MSDRRGFLSLGAGAAGALLLRPGPGAAQAQPHDNPMPSELRAAIEREGMAPVLGNPAGNITLTEFFDYNCPWCRKIMPVMLQLVAADPQLRLVFREWPIFGEDSYEASTFSLAALKQGKYLAFHKALMAEKGRAGKATATRAAKAAGLDLDKLKADAGSADVLAHIDHSMALGDHLGLAGTPTFIAGHDGLFGGQSLKDLQKLVANARAQLL
ncbi:DsbA family protein [Pseudogemmobacter faecipullorum]|uniref:DsbA family protein n=1 Tax=Pseudogemmobacter faecipullorum TaxID=2755041 RepID=A0ABS8CNP7_9RHOB|nr:DsbA family protein [Pseudogemmobacter faecipullorum]MCB5411018.1 DsbA family protein [Pseudogemmobacter faecipullorum]